MIIIIIIRKFITCTWSSSKHESAAWVGFACNNKKYVLWNMVSAHSRVHEFMAELCSNFGDSAITKGQIAYLSLRMRETPIFLLPVKNLTSPSSRVPRPRFPIRCSNFGDLATIKGQIAYFSLHMRKTALFLLPVKNLTSPLYCPTPISRKTLEFWRYVNI